MTLWLCHHNPASAFRRDASRLDIDRNPAPAIMAGGVHGDCRSHYWLEEDGVEPDAPVTDPGKPPYRVPTMAEIAATPRNGRRAVSTFSGAGGSCLGFRMAGFEVAWASEFVAAARDTYRANFPDTPLDARDIRTVQPSDILDAVGLDVGEIDVLEGSPPCAAFSTAGKRAATWGKISNYSDTQQRSDDLFFEYARLLRGLQPRTFVAENVSGLVKGVAKGYFKAILRELRSCGYVVQAQLLDAQYLGVPQMRQRIIFMGVRRDLAERYGVSPAFPSRLPYRYSVRDALPYIFQVGTAPPHREFVSHDRDVDATMVDADAGPNPTITTGPNKGVGHVRVRHDTSGERSQGDITDRPSPAVTVGVNGVNAQHYQVCGSLVDGATGEEADPETMITGSQLRTAYDGLGLGESSDRYFNLQRAHPEQPSGTVTALGGNTGLASVAHPTERRKFTIAELRRICSFPDDFVLTGSYAQQWERCGRAVPPLMMRAVAEALRDRVLARLP